MNLRYSEDISKINKKASRDYPKALRFAHKGKKSESLIL